MAQAVTVVIKKTGQRKPVIKVIGKYPIYGMDPQMDTPAALAGQRGNKTQPLLPGMIADKSDPHFAARMAAMDGQPGSTTVCNASHGRRRPGG